MTRRSLLSILALSLPVASLASVLPRRRMPVVEATPAVEIPLTEPRGHEVGGAVWTEALSGPRSGGGSWCQCPNCHGAGFVGADKDQCGYCKMSGTLWIDKRFGMYTPEGNAEVFRALAWDEWSRSNYYSESKGPKPCLAGMLYYIGKEHPEVYDTAVRDLIFVWLRDRYGYDEAYGQICAWADHVVVQLSADPTLGPLFERDDAAKLDNPPVLDVPDNTRVSMSYGSQDGCMTVSCRAFIDGKWVELAQRPDGVFAAEPASFFTPAVTKSRAELEAIYAKP